jgi:hypothetical protein
MNPLQATPATMVRYTARLGLLGTVAASSIQPYFSAMKKYFRDHNFLPFPVGDLLADARRGLEVRQQRLGMTDTRLPLPTPVTMSLLHAADSMRHALT